MDISQNTLLSRQISRLDKSRLFLTIQYGLLVINMLKEQEIQNAKKIILEKIIASEEKDAVVQNNLGAMYYEGKGVTQDYSKAREWFEKAALQGNTNAQNNLGLMYINKVGIPYNHVKAKEWL